MSEENDQFNGNGSRPSPEPEGPGPFANVVRLPTRAEREEKKRRQKQAQKQERVQNPSRREPLFNLPPVTKYLLGLFLLVHIGIALFLSPERQYALFNHFGFTPGYYSGQIPLNWPAFAGPFTYMFIHANWMHIGLNGLMLMAFGAGVERWMGKARMLVFFTLCSLASALAHFLLNPDSLSPVVGASGGLSGLFAAVLIMMNRQRDAAGMRHVSLLPLVLLWVAISVIFGVIGGPDGSTIAWAAHVGGFLAGFALIGPVMKMGRK